MEPEFTDVETPEEIAARKRRQRLLIAVLLLLIACAFFLFTRFRAANAPAAESAAPSELPPSADLAGTLFAAFLDVGQGDCIFLRAPDGKTMLIDGGPYGSFRTIRRFLDAMQVTRLDVVVATHLHEDHIGGLREVVEHYDIGVFYLSPFDIESSAYANLLEALDTEGVRAIPVYASETAALPWSGDPNVSVHVISPYKVQYDDENDTSVMLRVSYGATAILLAGDATEVSERLAIKAMHNRDLHANVLKVGHHGAQSSTSKKFLSVVKPELAVISVGSNNDYGHPSAGVLNRLAEANVRVLRTDELGTIRILLDGTSAQVVE